MNGRRSEQGTYITPSPALPAAPSPHTASLGLLPLAIDPDRPILRPAASVPLEISLQPSPEQAAIVASRRADPAGSLRVVAFAGCGKTTALRLRAEADSNPPEALQAW